MSDDAINAEFSQLHQALLNEPEQGHTVELFRGKNLKRTAIVVGMNFFQQATGQTFASQYGEDFQSACAALLISITDLIG